DGDILFARDGELIIRNPRLSLQPFVIQSCEVDFDDNSKETFQPHPDIGERNEEFAQATTLALFDYLRKSKSRGFALSLSGGADSSCCAVLVAEMIRRGSTQLGWSNFSEQLNISAKNEKEATQHLLTCAYQGTRNSSAATLEAAKILAESIGATFHHWQVDDEVESYKSKIETVLNRPLSWENDDIALQNIQARSRSPIIWMLANIKQAILLTTSNRSEGGVGYTTMDGDTSGSLAPIAGVDKPFIIQWLKWAEKDLGYKGLALVNGLSPTAELRPADADQTDEKDLMPYHLLVRIEKLAIRDRKSPREVYSTLITEFDKDLLKTSIVKFFRLWSINQWKRERIAPSFHLDDMNIDPRSWCRFPILSGGFQAELAGLGD
ncbi:MAG TPA: NAD(+) synthase, partial [Cyclobacteriaceae bacterium]|nr:NAD(+) synthase [Cyclobacteriaceae bacterium]